MTHESEQHEGGNRACQNTDRELWRAKEDDCHSPSIHVTQHGSIGINVGGTVFVMPIEVWHALANTTPATPSADEEIANLNLGVLELADEWFLHDKHNRERCRKALQVAVNVYNHRLASLSQAHEKEREELRTKYVAEVHRSLEAFASRDKYFDEVQQLRATLSERDRELRNRDEALEARKKYVEDCNHSPQLVIDSEEGPICCECWALGMESVVKDVRASIANFLPADANIDERPTLDALNAVFKLVNSLRAQLAETQESDRVIWLNLKPSQEIWIHLNGDKHKASINLGIYPPDSFIGKALRDVLEKQGVIK